MLIFKGLALHFSSSVYHNLCRPINFLMRVFQIIVALLAFHFSAVAQEYLLGTPMRVLDFGEIYSTYSWDESTKKTIAAEFGILPEDLARHASESGWPTGIASLDARARNKQQMNDYTLFFMEMLNEHVALLLAPRAENGSMPADMRPANDIFFVINVFAIEENSLETSEENHQGFAAQMEAITQDFKYGFSNVVNGILEKDIDGMAIYYGTQVPMDGADEIFFLEDLMSASTQFHAGFPGHTDPAKALVNYQNLVRKVEALSLSCCTMTKSTEIVTGNSRRQPFYTLDPHGKLAPEYKNMVIEMSLERGETFDDEGQILDYWFPVLAVYER